MSRTCSNRRGKPQSAPSPLPALPAPPTPAFLSLSPFPSQSLFAPLFVQTVLPGLAPAEHFVSKVLASGASSPGGQVEGEGAGMGTGTTGFKIQSNYASPSHFPKGLGHLAGPWEDMASWNRQHRGAGRSGQCRMAVFPGPRAVCPAETRNAGTYTCGEWMNE